MNPTRLMPCPHRVHLSTIIIAPTQLIPVLDAYKLPLALQPAFQIDRGATAIAGSGNRLAVAMIGNIAGGEGAWNVRRRMLSRMTISDPVHSNNVAEQLSIRLMADCQENALHCQRTLLAGAHIAHIHPCHCLL